VSAYLSHGPTLQFYHVSLIPRFGTSRLRFLKHYLLCIPTPEVSRSRTPHYSLSQLATSGLSGQSLDLLFGDMPKCRNSDTSSMWVPKQNFPPFWSFGLRNFLNPDAKFLVLKPKKPRNTEFRCTSPITSSQKSFHPFETFETKVSTSYPSICRNAKILTRRQRGSHNGTSCLFGVSEFATF
jgi:hypothetical protein